MVDRYRPSTIDGLSAKSVLIVQNELCIGNVNRHAILSASALEHLSMDMEHPHDSASHQVYL